ncbi:MAG: hypothetical protein EPO13_00290 [Actinomycetota bacterium]|nr:MAG: hypothetical protein EPO13_00290 [Actinomycetota bacterium]
MRTDLSGLPLPGDVLERVANGPQSAVGGQSVVVPMAWWHRNLEGLPGRDLFGAVDTAQVSRRDVFTLASASDTNDGALTLLWWSLAWGAGNRLRLCSQRIDSVREDVRGAGTTLRRAAALAGDGPGAAFRLLAGPDRIKYLGAAFFTKYLYFAGCGRSEHPCLILDANVALALHDRGWSSLKASGGWGADTYERYVELARRWSTEATLAAGRTVAPAEIELALFKLGRADR